MAKLERVARFSRILQVLTVSAMIVLPLAIIVGMRVGVFWEAPYPADLIVESEISRTQVTMVFILALIKPIILLWILNEMRKLFVAYSKGAILTNRSARLIQRIGQGFVAMAVADFLFQPLFVLILTMANPPGSRSLAISLNSDMMFFALAGGLIIVVGWAMREAAAAAAENRSFV
ncbi:DUF2975 domain-containing protein [Cognatiyoonia sp. IB215182]|uniref:DUF2975 domain-containing protein n=1 Tax=Cognatiyoonia sp. IB215182 TaxID=3097353 RepID=UPI002A0DBA81|nr:DUF2975 domain-containing protein [Cognatiyoonia sp. IB215182]MDX8352835.1 DUF2975 domain-containing protein [Cognatiyoonia sp. IB215182]